MTIILPPRYQIPHLEECLRHLFHFLASCIIWYAKGLLFLLQYFVILSLFLLLDSIILQYLHFFHAMIWEWRLITSLWLKSGPSKILRHLVTSKTINLKNTSCKKHNLTTSFFCSFKAKNVTSCEHRHVLLNLSVKNSSTTHKSTKNASSNNWLSSQTNNMYKLPYFLHLSEST